MHIRLQMGTFISRTKKFAEYGKLSHQPLDDLQAGARISVGEQKEDAMDFAVWKAAKRGRTLLGGSLGQRPSGLAH